MVYDREKDYCTKSPEGLFGVKFNYACYLHDRQYSGGSKKRKTRKEADLQLKRQIIKAYNVKNKAFLGILVGWVYYFGVRLFGGKSWKENI